ncbi:hypothetical protein DYB37_004561 [Aphanomyces astaci]|uniref:Uncharacterized protein n=1 Tax=Aphanomyces astaci TaxID=112090 RepID=A0A3R7BWL6_APHAT|nr:hypothetical protein DYB37_004561 [Aphanomyces astaci]
MDNQIEEMVYEGCARWLQCASLMVCVYDRLDGTFTSTTPRHGCVPPPLDKFPDDNLDNLRLQLDEVEQVRSCPMLPSSCSIPVHRNYDRQQSDDVEAKSNLVHSTRLKCSHLERQLESLVGRETDLEGGGQSFHDPNEDEATSEALASFDRLESFFNLTALGIILDHGAHDKFLQGSSRHTIQAWFRQATQADVPYHQWHRWLTIRIAGSSSQDGFRFFRPRKSLSVEAPSTASSPSSLAGAIADFFDKYKRKPEPNHSNL